jgi:DNA ligase-1
MLRWQTERLLSLETRRDEWTVYVQPKFVAEIAYSDLRESTRYPGGLALRFARKKPIFSTRALWIFDPAW